LNAAAAEVKRGVALHGRVHASLRRGIIRGFAMAALRALVYFVEEALTSLWRSRLINILSILTIAVSLFVVGAFFTVGSNLSRIVAEWTEKVQVVFYLDDTVEPRIHKILEDRLHGEATVDNVRLVSREEALARFRALFRDLESLADDLGENPFPASFEVTLKAGHESPAEVLSLVRAYERAPGVADVQYDLLWIQRLSDAIRLIHVVGAFLGTILALAGVFTISNVIRLTVYARQDELDIMRLVGATNAYVRGPFVAEGVLLGGMGGAAAAAFLWLAFRFFVRDALASSDLLGRASASVPEALGLGLVAGGMLVGLVGSLISLGRSRL
jgi:cell division transport system permease protein